MVGKDGNLYFAHLTTEDSREDYICNVQYLLTRTILAKEPTILTVNPCELYSLTLTLIDLDCTDITDTDMHLKPLFKIESVSLKNEQVAGVLH